MNNRQLLMAIEKIKILGGIFGATSSVNPDHLPKKWAKWDIWAELAVLFSW
jgi:hypothetical protein